MANKYNIEKLLDAKLNSIVGKPAIAWTNAKFTPDVTKPYLRPRYVTTVHDDSVVSLDGYIRNKGIYQVDVYVPIDTGVGQLRTVSQLVMDAFVRGSKLSDGTVEVLIRSIKPVFVTTVDNWLIQPIEVSTVSFI